MRDPDKLNDALTGSVLELLKVPVIWPILILMMVNYVLAARIRGLWAGPYLQEVFGVTGPSIGLVTLVMGVAMAFGNFIFWAT